MEPAFLKPPGIDLDPVLGNWPAEEQMSEAAREEVEQMHLISMFGVQTAPAQFVPELTL